MVFSEVEVFVVVVLGGGFMKFLGVVSWSVVGEKLGVIVFFLSDCICIWLCCGVNLSFWRRLMFGRDGLVVFVMFCGVLKGLWLVVRLAWFSLGIG